jgi:cytochrome c553
MFKPILLALYAISFILVSSSSAQVYTMGEIYDKMCIRCHSDDGSGNPDKLTPSMRDLSLQEIKDSLKEVENEEGHIIMEHNREKILEEGMEYDAEKMSEYLYNRMHPKGDK